MPHQVPTSYDRTSADKCPLSEPINMSEKRLTLTDPDALPIALLLIALAEAVVAVAGSWYTIVLLRDLLDGTVVGGLFVTDIVFAALALASAALVLPWQRAFRNCLRVRHARERKQTSIARSELADARTNLWITLGYSTALIFFVAILQFFLANNHAVASTFLNWKLIISTFPLVVTAFWLNVKLFLISAAIGLTFGLLVAVAEIAPDPAGKPLRIIAIAYVDTFRAIPAILVLFLVGFGIPLTGLPILGDLSQMTLMVIALSLTVSAYFAEIYRAGILSVHWSQAAAARSLGLSYMQTLRHVVVPQGVRNIIPPLLNSLIALQKDTALVTVIGAIDAFNQSMIIAGNYYNLSAVTTVAFLFVLISVPQTRFVEHMMARDRAKRASGV